MSENQQEPNQADGGENKIQELMKALKSQRNFQHMPDQMLENLLRVMKVVHYDHGSILMEQGKTYDFTCILLQGNVAIFVDGKHLLNLRRTGELIGEMSFVNEGPCSATIKAETDTKIIQISKATLTEIGDSDFYLWLCRVLAEKLKRTSQLVSREKLEMEKGGLIGRGR